MSESTLISTSLQPDYIDLVINLPIHFCAICCLLVQLSSELGTTEEVLAKQLPSLLTGEGKPLSQGMNMLKDELTFAEDLILV